MLDYFFCIFCFLSALNLKIKGLDEFFQDYMELDNTNCIKGLFIWLIIFHHKTVYGINKNYLYKDITRNLGQKIVSMFLFYSGFGILESIKRKGFIYTKSLPIKALVLFLKSQIILFLFFLANIFILENRVSLKLYCLSVIFKSSLGNSNWFAFTIIILYCYSFLSFRFIKNQYFIGIIIMTIICLLHIILVYKFYYPKIVFAVDTVLCFILGLFYSYLKIYLDKIIMGNDLNYFLFITITIFIYYKVFSITTLFFISITNVLFALIIIFITMKVQFNNDFLKFLNSHSYSIYLLQRLVFSIVYKKQIFINSDFIQISFEFTAIIYISSIFDKCTTFIDNFFRRYSHKNGNNNYILIEEVNFNNIIHSNLISLSSKN